MCPYCETPVDTPTASRVDGLGAGGPRPPAAERLQRRDRRAAHDARYDLRPHGHGATLVLLKPDAIRRGLAGEVVARFERRGLDLRGARLLRISRELAGRHYAEHEGKPFYGDLVSFITSGPTMALAIEGESAISVVRAMMGATNPVDSPPGTIRGDFAIELLGQRRARIGLEGQRKRELSLFFPDGLV